MTTPLISIITSLYKGDDFIEHFLIDITRQTIFKDMCELLIINANSTGKERKIIYKYIQKFPYNIKYIQFKKDPGIYSVWNFAIKYSRGQFITNANVDDRKAKNSLETHVRTLLMYPNVDIVYAPSFVTLKPNETFKNNSSNGKLIANNHFSKINWASNPMWRKNIHKKIGGFNSIYKSSGDYDFFNRCILSNLNIKKINVVLGLYYANPKGLSTNPDNMERNRKEDYHIRRKYSKYSKYSKYLKYLKRKSKSSNIYNHFADLITNN